MHRKWSSFKKADKFRVDALTAALPRPIKICLTRCRTTFFLADNLARGYHTLFTFVSSQSEFACIGIGTSLDAQNAVRVTTRQENVKMTKHKPIKVIDLFAGPGGLGEGFSSLTTPEGQRNFSLGVSIEKDPIAHMTLSLRALYRAFPTGKVPDCYYQYVKGKITRDQLLNHPEVTKQVRDAVDEAKNAELGKTPPSEVDKWIKKALNGDKEWVLIGGPPCQAYSLVGRARRTREDIKDFEKDEKHFLYKEYLRIIKKFKPSVFVMENVKGILSSQHGGTHIFQRILDDLSSPAKGLSYQIRSFVVPGESKDLEPTDFIIKSERFGVPQNRHRVILFGIRSGLAKGTQELREHPHRFVLEQSQRTATVKEVLNDLPPLRSRLSREPDSDEAWLAAVEEGSALLADWDGEHKNKVVEIMKAEAEIAAERKETGGQYVSAHKGRCLLTEKQKEWFLNPKLAGFTHHETRSHMRSDIHRYMFASSFAKAAGASPKLPDFPPDLLPDHENATDKDAPFTDRFRVQLPGSSSSTVVSHIAKDGHHFIHYDPSQCRSLTVREAARLQTFPDDYFFEGNRTQQYTQVGNAVPPWLAKKIATVVLKFIKASRQKPEPKKSKS